MKRARKHDEDNGFGAWGGYMEAKISKLEEQFLGVTTKHACQVSNIFNGISIFVNGYTNPSATELKTLMAEHGGIFHHYHRPGRTTYVIASNLPDVKIKSITTCKIISPLWVTDCIKAQKLIDHSKYLLYSNQSKTQPKLSFKSKATLKTEDISNCTKPDIDTQISPDLFDSSGELFPGDNVTDPRSTTNKFSFDENTILDQCENFLNVKEDLETNLESNNLKKSLSNIDFIEPAPSTSTVVIDNSNPDKISTIDSQINNKITAREISVISPANIPQDNRKTSIKTAIDPGFLTEFYNNSRLHHIATLGAGFKQYVTQLREKSSGVFPGLEELKGIDKKKLYRNTIEENIIMHIDMDCFFVSVGLRTRPHLKGLPIAVTHSKGGTRNQVRPGTDIKLEIEMYKQRHQSNTKDGEASKELSVVESRLCNIGEFDSLSEIASCSYEARKAGITNGMFVGAALKLCPDLKTIPYDFDGYKEVAYALYDTIAKYTLNIEAVSCDEMFVDCTDLLKTTSTSVHDFASHIRAEIKRKTSCPCSTGFGGNKLLARLATKKAKPDGQYHLIENYVEEYLNEISISDLPGVGRSTMSRLKTLGCNQCGDLKDLSLAFLQKEFGSKVGESLYKNCRGIDERPLVYEQVRKSVSAEVNYGIRFTNSEEYETFLRKLAAEVHSRLREISKKGRCITLKLMVRAKEAPKETAKYMGHGFCDNMSKCQTLNQATDDIDVITKSVMNISSTMDIEAKELRGIGIQISRLENLQSNANAKGSLTTFFRKAAEKSIQGKPDMARSISDESSVQCDESINTEINAIVKKSTVNSIKSFAEPVKKFEPVPSTTSVSKENFKSKDTKVEKKSPKSSPKKGNKTKGKKGKTLMRNKSNNTLDMFFGSRKNSSLNTDNIDLEKLGIDPEVLSSLPEDIKAEVIADYRYQAQKLNKPGPSRAAESPKPKINVDQEFLDALPEDIRREIEADVKMSESLAIAKNNYANNVSSSTRNDEGPAQTPKRNVPNADSVCGVEYSAIFGDIAKTRSLIRAWITRETVPKHCDVEMLTKYLTSQVEEDIHNVYFVLKFFHRIISEQLPHETICKWHKAYAFILNGVQNAVKNFYGNKLFVENRFQCDSCCEI